MYKLLLSRVRLVPAFCKRCGADVRDYAAPAEFWRRIAQHVPKAGAPVLCYNCFCDVCAAEGLPSVWRLTAVDADDIDAADTTIIHH